MVPMQLSGISTNCSLETFSCPLVEALFLRNAKFKLEEPKDVDPKWKSFAIVLLEVPGEGPLLLVLWYKGRCILSWEKQHKMVAFQIYFAGLATFQNLLFCKACYFQVITWEDQRIH